MNYKSIRFYLFLLLWIISFIIVGCLGLKTTKLSLDDVTITSTVTPNPTPTRYIITISISTETAEVPITEASIDYKKHILKNRIDFGEIPPGVYLLYTDWKSSDNIYGVNIETNEEVFFSEYMFSYSNNKNFTSYRTDDRNLMILNLNTEDEEEIEFNLQCYERSWSPDDKYLAVNCEDQIYVINTEDFGVQQLTSSIHPVVDSYQNPMWSPDGKWIATTYHDLMSLNSTEENGIYLIDSDCINQSIQCKQNMVGPFFPYSIHAEYSWSPDSERIVTYLNNAIQVVNIDTNESTRLIDKVFDIGGLNWSPDGDWIFFSQFFFGIENTINIYKIPAQGGEPILVAEDKGFISTVIEVSSQ